MLVNLSQRLKAKISAALNGADSCIYFPRCTLHNPNTGYEFRCRNVKDIVLWQDFETSYMDTMSVTTDITPAEYQELLRNVQDLECTLTLTPQDPFHDRDLLEQDPIVVEMKVFLEEQTDIEKQHNINLFTDTETERPETPSQANAIFAYTFNLISKEMHDMRQVNVNAILNNCTMEDVLHWACQQFGVTNTEIIPPDNQERYASVIIPPMHSLATLFPYLQERYGIYSKGLGYYYTNDTFYIYPEYDVEQSTTTTDSVVQLINAPERYFIGLDRYHAMEDDDILIASISEATATPRNAKGAENIGTTHISANADSMRDQYVTVDEKGKVTRSKDDIAVISLQNNAGNATSNMQNVRYAGERTNIYSSTSALAEINGTTLETVWVCAVPWMIVPGQNVTYHFDSANHEYKTQRGRILRIGFLSQRHSGPALEPNLSFVAKLQVFLEPDQQDDSEVQFTER